MQDFGQLSIFSTSPTWFTAEGIEAHLPVLFRCRHIREEFIGTPILPRLLVIDLAFASSDSTGLPQPIQYDHIEQFEHTLLDKLELAKLGLVALIKTFNGTVRYFIYVEETDRVLRLLDDYSSHELSFASCEDPSWSEFTRFLASLHD